MLIQIVFLRIIWIAIVLITIISLIIQVAIGVWIYKDAKKRKMEAALWLLIVLLTGLIGLIIYFIVRDPKSSRSSVQPTYIRPTPQPIPKQVITPHESVKPMGKEVKFCTNCGGTMRKDAIFCPQCGNKV